MYKAFDTLKWLHHLPVKALLLLFGLTANVYKVDAQTAEQVDNRLTLLTYNVRHGEGMDGKTDYARQAEVIRRSGAQFVALQEIDSVTARSGGRDVLRELALETRLYPTFARAIGYGGGAYGVGILSVERPLSVRRIALPGREEGRVLLVAEFSRFVLGCTHLSLTEADRMASLPLIVREAERQRKPFVLAGDWNAHPNSEFVKAAKQHFALLSPTDKATYPADKPNECLDYVALYKGNAPEPYKPWNSVLKAPNESDHRPVSVVLQMALPVSKLFYAAPYLQNLSPGGVTVMTQLHGMADTWVEYGTDTLHLHRARTLQAGQAVCHNKEHCIRLDSLTEGTRYYYRVAAREVIDYQSYSHTFGRTVRTPFYSFTTPSTRTDSFTAIVLNDLHDHPGTIRALQQLVSRLPHDFVVFNGDCLAEPADADHAIRIVTRLTEAFGGAEKPLFFVRGNHEIRNAYSAGMTSLIEYPGGHTYGAFSWGDTRFVMLDCGEDKPDDHWVYAGLNDFTQFRAEQLDFLQRELKSREFRRATRRILIHHVPLWGNTDDYRPCSEMWCPVLERAPFDVDLAAHTHEFKYYDKGRVGNPCPVYVGGGYETQAATLCILTKKGKHLQMRVLNAQGKELKCVDL